MWPATGYTFLHSGQPLPSDNERATRVVGQHVADGDMSPVHLERGSIEMVDECTYLGSNITSDGEVKQEVLRYRKSFRLLAKAHIP